MDALELNPQARSVFEPVLEGRAKPSHAYLLHGPSGSGRSEVAELVATALLAEGSARDDTSARVRARTHPDLTWITPQGANGEVLVDDIRDRVIAAAPMTPFESKRRVFVIEAADRMNESAANAFLKTLEEPPSYAHLILTADSLDSVMATIVSRCQPVRFAPATPESLARQLEAGGTEPDVAAECAALADGDGERAQLLASEQGAGLRRAGESIARSALVGGSATARPWVDLLAAASARGKVAGEEVIAASAERLEFAGKSERSRLEREAEERGKRATRRAEGRAVDAALHVAEAWLRDLHRASVGASELIAGKARRDELERLAGSVAANRIRSSIDMVGRTRRAMALNVNRELALETLAHRLDGALG